MSSWLIAFVGVIYIACAVDFGFKANWAMCITFIGYAFANIGLYLAARG